MVNSLDTIKNWIASEWNASSYPGVLAEVTRAKMTFPRPFSIKVETFQVTFKCTNVDSQEEMFRVLQSLPCHAAQPVMLSSYWHGNMYVNRFELVIQS